MADEGDERNVVVRTTVNIMDVNWCMCTDSGLRAEMGLLYPGIGLCSLSPV